MILYKYYGFDSGISALRSGKLGFRKPKSLNDPFELSFFSKSKGHDKTKPNEIQIYIDNLKNSVVILSMSRTPNNHLMWTHYAENHTGFVIGYQVNDLFLTSREFNIITVNEGDVVYTNAKGPKAIDNHTLKILQEIHAVSLGADLDLSMTTYDEFRDLARKMFLIKHANWVYEEEVRVVKVLNSIFEEAPIYQNHIYRSFSTLYKDVAPGIAQSIIDDLFLYDYKVKIKEVYLGARDPLRRISKDERYDLSLVEEARDKKWKVFGVNVSTGSWQSSKQNLIGYDFLKMPPKRSNFTQISGTQLLELNKKLMSRNISSEDQFEITEWDGKIYIKQNSEFI